MIMITHLMKKKRSSWKKLDEKTNKHFQDIQKKEKGVDKKEFMRYFDHEPTALVNRLLSQNTQDLKKKLDKIKE